MRTFIGGSGQLPEVKPSVTKLADLSVADPAVALKLLELRHISPDGVRYEIVSDPQKIKTVPVPGLERSAHGPGRAVRQR
jgi:hypothetical protein